MNCKCSSLSLLLALLIFHTSFGLAESHHQPGVTSGGSQLEQYVEQASEFSSRARANVYFPNPQSIFKGVQVSFVNVGAGNLSFLRRDMVASGRMPLVLARVYDSSSKGTMDFGQGWRLTAAESISVSEGKARLTAEDGSAIDFIQDSDNSFRLENDYASDYLSLVKTAPETLQATLRTGFVKEFTLLGDEFLLTKVTDRNGNALRLVYKNRLLARMENLNHFIAFTRNRSGLIRLAQDDEGRRVSYKYDNHGRLVEADDLGNHPWQYSYSEEGMLKTATDPLQRLNFAVFFDENGRVRRLQLPSGVIQYSYDPANHATIVTDRKQLISRFFQNEEGITTRVVNALGEETSIGLDASRNVISLSRNGSIVETMQYDHLHRLLSRHSATDSGSIERRYSYDQATGLLNSIHSSSGDDQNFSYDRRGNLTSATLADGVHQLSYSAGGDLSALSAQNSKLKFTADADGLIASMTNEHNASAAMSYKAGGELAEVVFPNHARVRYKYQLSGLRTELVYDDGRRVEYSYDPAGNLTSSRVFDAKGNQVNGQKLEMNDSYQLVRWTLADGTETAFSYDANGNLTEIRKGKSHTRFEYDALDRLTAVVTPDGHRLTYVYKPGERSLLEQHEHASILVADLRDTGLTFTGPLSAVASRPLTAAFGSVRFSESLGTFQLANADGSEVVRPHENIEAALAKLHLFAPGMTEHARQSGFNIPFNTMFMPAEYLTINCCPECYYDYEEGGWVCPPCLPPPPPPGTPDHLIVQSDVTQTQNCPSQTVVRDIIYEIVDFNDNMINLVTSQRESFDSISPNTCNNVFTINTNCTAGFSFFVHDHLTIGCNAVGGSCGVTLTNQHWFACQLTGDIMIGSPGDIVGHNDIVLVGGTLFMVPGTHIYP